MTKGIIRRCNILQTGLTDIVKFYRTKALDILTNYLLKLLLIQHLFVQSIEYNNTFLLVCQIFCSLFRKDINIKEKAVL